MGFPAQLDHADVHFPDDDSVSHFAAKEIMIVLRVLVAMTIVASAVTMATFWFWAWIPVTLLLVSYVTLLAVGRVERRTRVTVLESRASEHRLAAAHQIAPEADSAIEAAILARDEAHFTPMPLLKKESIIGIEVLIGLGLAAIVLAFILVPWKLLVLGSVLFFLYMLFVMGPIWLGWLNEVEDNESGQSTSNEHLTRPT